MNKADRRPGDHLLDTYVPDLAPDERELARARLQEFARLMLDMAIRQLRAAVHREDSAQAPDKGRIPETPLDQS